MTSRAEGAACRVEGAAHELLDRRRREDGRARPRELEQIAHDVAQAFGLFLDNREERVSLGALLLQRGDGVEDDGERVPHLVRDDGGELSDGGEPFLPDELLVRPRELVHRDLERPRVRDEAPRERSSDGEDEDEHREVEEVRPGRHAGRGERIVHRADEDRRKRDRLRGDLPLAAHASGDEAKEQDREPDVVVREREEPEARRDGVDIDDVEPRHAARVRLRREDDTGDHREERDEHAAARDQALPRVHRAMLLRCVVLVPGDRVEAAEEDAQPGRKEERRRGNAERRREVGEAEERRERRTEREPAKLETTGRRRHSEREERRKQADRC